MSISFICKILEFPMSIYISKDGWYMFCQGQESKVNMMNYKTFEVLRKFDYKDDLGSIKLQGFY